MNSAETAFMVANDFGQLQTSAQAMAAALILVKKRISGEDSIETRSTIHGIEMALAHWKRTAKQIGVESGIE